MRLSIRRASFRTYVAQRFMWRPPRNARKDGLFGVDKRHITFGSETVKELHDARVRAPHLCRLPFPARVTGSQRLGLHLKIDFGINVGGVDRNVSEPRTNGVDVDSCAQEMGCGCVADCVRAGPFPGQRWNLLGAPPRMPFDQRMDSEACHRSTVAVQENKAVLRPACDQRSQNGHRSRPQGAEPDFSALPTQPHCTAASVIPFEIGDLHPCRLARPRAGVV